MGEGEAALEGEPHRGRAELRLQHKGGGPGAAGCQGPGCQGPRSGAAGCQEPGCQEPGSERPCPQITVTKSVSRQPRTRRAKRENGRCFHRHLVVLHLPGLDLGEPVVDVAGGLHGQVARPQEVEATVEPVQLRGLPVSRRQQQRRRRQGGGGRAQRSTCQGASPGDSLIISCLGHPPP